MNELRKKMERMFEADRNVSLNEWFDQFPMYDGDSQLGADPWWPPLSEVWRCQGELSEAWKDQGNCGYVQSWPEAWKLLNELYAEYNAAKLTAEN